MLSVGARPPARAAASGFLAYVLRFGTETYLGVSGGPAPCRQLDPPAVGHSGYERVCATGTGEDGDEGELHGAENVGERDLRAGVRVGRL